MNNSTLKWYFYYEPFPAVVDHKTEMFKLIFMPGTDRLQDEAWARSLKLFRFLPFPVQH